MFAVQVDRYFGDLLMRILNIRARIVLLIIRCIGLFVRMFTASLFVRFMNFF
jgi:hypothetical protein